MSYFEQANADNAISRPHLIWVIQNFRLQLTQENGEEITGREWIEKLLQQVDQSNNGTSAFRKQFNEFFSSLHMKTLPYPVKTVDDLHSLSSLKSSQLDSYRAAGAFWKVKTFLCEMFVLFCSMKILTPISGSRLQNITFLSVLCMEFLAVIRYSAGIL